MCDLDLLDASVHDELDAKASHRLDEHLQGCASCKAELALLRSERAMFAERAARLARPTDALWRGVAAGIAPRKSSRVALWAGGLVATAAAVVLLARLGPMVPGYYGASVSTPPITAPGAALPNEVDREALRALPSAGNTWRFNTGPTPTLDVDVVAGKVDIVHGDDATVEVSATITHGVYFEATPRGVRLHVWTDKTINRQWKLAVYEEGNTVKVRAWCAATDCGDSPFVRFQVKVPSKTRTSLHAISAEVKASDVLGSVAMQTVSGDIHLSRCGDVKLKSTSGDVILDHHLGGVGDIETISGDVDWRNGHCDAGCSLKISTISGDVALDPDATSHFKLAFSTVSGDGETGSRSSGPGAITVKTVSGDLHFGR